MERDELRLECLKIASRFPDHNEAIARAEEYYDFVVKNPAQETKAKIVPPAQASAVKATENINSLK